MASVTLTMTEPVLNDCEVAWTSSSGLETSVVKKGIGSAKFTSGLGTPANTLMGHDTIPLWNLTSATSLKIWVRCTATTSAGSYKILLDDTAACASPIEAIDLPAISAANTWEEKTLSLAAAASCGSIISVGVRDVAGGISRTLYVDEIRANTLARTYSNCPSARGFDAPDDLRLYPYIENEYADGSVKTVAKKAARVMTVDFGVLQDSAERNFLIDFIRHDGSKSVTYGSETIVVEVVDVQDYQSIWHNNVSLARRYVLKLREKTMWQKRPSSWN